ncbi:MAG TPA: dihydrodipicolinate synthase family protein [Mucilaginibacter sp.]|jgi:4-hydroxy-tetrahydrodipicolinate synthase
MTNKNKYKGIAVPAITPITVKLKLDHAAVEKLFGYFHEHQVMPFINGTTGESALLPYSLKKEFIKTACKLKAKGDTLYAGISANCLEESVEQAKLYFDTGVDVVAATLPSYYMLSADQMKKYFEQLAGQVPGPVIIYNIPSTTGMSISLKVIDELSHHENIVGTKDSERSEARLKESLELWSSRNDFCHFLGWANKSAEALIGGSDGLIPSTGNLFPGIYYDMYKAVSAGDHEKALQLQKLSDVLGDVYQKGKLLGESLWALKVLMNELGLCDEYVMPPLYSLSIEEKNKLIKNFHRIITQENLLIKPIKYA